MSKIIVDDIKHSSSSINNLALGSTGNVTIGGSGSTTDQGYRLTLQGSANATYCQYFDSTTGTTYGSDGTIIGLINGDSYLYNREAKSVIFGTSNNERARITSDGVFCVGGTVFGASGALTIKPNYDDGAAQIITERANTTNVSIVWEMKNNGGQVGRIEHDHTSAGLVSGSDYRLKEKDTPISDGITRVKQLRPIRFNWKAEPSKTVDGFFAHEVQSIVPEAVSGEKDAVDKDNNIIMQGMVTERLVPLLTAALKEAIAKIETLETKVAALEGGG